MSFKIPCGGFKLDEKSFSLDKNDVLSIPKPLTYDYMPEGYPKKDGWSIEWDGNTEGLTYIPIAEGSALYKISDFLPTDDELIGAILELSNGRSTEITSNDINSSLCPGMTIVAPGGIYIVRQDNIIFDGITLSEKGVYTFFEQNSAYAKKLSNENTALMSEEFIPSIPADKLPDIPVIEFSKSIVTTILGSTTPEYVVTNLNYSGILDIVNKGYFVIKDTDKFYRPISWSVSPKGLLKITIVSRWANDSTSIVYATLSCGNGINRFYRDAYWTITTTKG